MDVAPVRLHQISGDSGGLPWWIQGKQVEPAPDLRRL